MQLDTGHEDAGIRKPYCTPL